MKTYEFKLTYSVRDAGADLNALVEQLGKAGCTDALVGIGKAGRIALDFSRQADSAFDAVSSAVADVKQGVPDLKLTEAKPDLVGLTDIAKIMDFSRQYVHKIVLSSGPAFPPPVHEGKPALWHLSQVLVWLAASTKYAIDQDLAEVAQANMYFNLAKDLQEIDAGTRARIFSLVSTDGR